MDTTSEGDMPGSDLQGDGISESIGGGTSPIEEGVTGADTSSRNPGDTLDDENAPVVAEPASGETGSPSAESLSQIDLSLRLAQGTRVRLTVEALPASGEGTEPTAVRTIYMGDGKGDQAEPISVSLSLLPADEGLVLTPVSRGIVRPRWPGFSLSQALSRLRDLVKSWPYTLEATLFGLSLLIYLTVRLVGLTSYPIYFFSDEAVQTLLAADFIRDNFKNSDGEFLPTYFYNVDKYSLGTTVYIQVLPYLLFGKSAFATRATSVLITLLAAVCVGLILRDILKLPYWWAGTLLLSIMPAWFLHSRTAFETVVMVSFYAGGLYFYLLYRYRSPRYLFVALALFALSFYSYNPGQVIVTLTGVLLLVSDARYHWRNRKVALLGLGLLVLLALPYLRFRYNHSTALQDHLVTLGSYWIHPMPVGEKVARFAEEYLYGLSPGYWFVPNNRDLERHLMKGYGHLHRASLPFAVLGMAVALKNFRSSAYRAVLIVWLAAPAGAALVHIAVTRNLVMVVPATLLISIGVITVFTWLESKRLSRTLLSLSAFAILAGLNFILLWNALQYGPTWFKDYSLSGMQFGAAQVFEAVEDHLEGNPADQLIVSPSWANSADILARFFLSDPLPIRLGSIEDYLVQHLSLEEGQVFVMTPREFERASTSGKFTDVQVHRTVPYPDNRPGFYFVELRYVDDIETILSVEREARRQLQEAEVILDGQQVKVRHSLLDMGQIQDLWDDFAPSVARTFEANPFIVEMDFPVPRSLSGLSMIVGDTKVKVVAQLYASAESEPVEYVAEMGGSVQNPEVAFGFGETISTKVLHLEIYDLKQSEPGHVHVWEIELH